MTTNAELKWLAERAQKARGDVARWEALEALEAAASGLAGIIALVDEVERLRGALKGDREVRPMPEERLERILEFQERVRMVKGPNDDATLTWADQEALIEEAVICFRARQALATGEGE